MSSVRIVFVCTGNTGRSVMAAALARQWFDIHDGTADIISRGIAPAPDLLAAEPEAADLLLHLGIDVSNHRAKRFTDNDVQTVDLILTATAEHKRTLLHHHSDAALKTFTMSEYAFGKSTDIADAFGQPMAAYDEALSQIQFYIPKVCEAARRG